MWAMEYNPNIFSKYEKPDRAKTKGTAPTINDKILKQYGKFERKNVKTGHTEENSALAVFLVASVLEIKNRRILNEAKGVDDVVKVSLSFHHMYGCISVLAYVSACISLCNYLFRSWVTSLQILMLRKHVLRH